ncbi:MAG TPA: DUF4870 domain-containing protein [Candidatus Hydrogenedentes bacterium]|jgi:hypothetical protein|nr:DUF4870 domain-containing protein [Candidatus Hydrogenedentota bacterium]
MPDDMDTGLNIPDEPIDESPAYEPQNEEAGTDPAFHFGRGKDERMWGMACHLSGAAILTCIPFANVLGPFVIWMLKREDYAFVDKEGKEAVNFQLTMFIAMAIGYVLSLLGIGLLILLAVAVVDLIFVLIASMKANEGESYRYPLTFRFIK